MRNEIAWCDKRMKCMEKTEEVELCVDEKTALMRRQC
jgi:hypothetical protein